MKEVRNGTVNLIHTHTQVLTKEGGSKSLLCFSFGCGLVGTLKTFLMSNAFELFNLC